jgi:hypothetical protein
MQLSFYANGVSQVYVDTLYSYQVTYPYIVSAGTDSTASLSSIFYKAPNSTATDNSFFLSFKLPYPSTDTLAVGNYTYATYNPVTYQDSVNVKNAGQIRFSLSSTAPLSYNYLLSDTVSILASNGQFASGTFQATLSTALSGGSIMHITNGAFKDIVVTYTAPSTTP